VQLTHLKTPDKESYIPVLESCIIGLVAGLSAVALSAGVSWLGSLRVHFSEIWPSCYVLPAFGLVGGLIAGLLVERVAPEASGSGIPQVRARLDRIVMALDFRIALVKLLGGTVALGAGFFLGREGPTVQLGAALAAPLARWLPTTAAHKRQLIAAGAGAGLTAAFNAPLAGIIFVLEELLKEIKPTTIIITVIACSVSCFVLNLFGPPHMHTASDTLEPMISFAPRDVPFYVLLGVVAGLFGAVFNAAILGSLKLNRDLLRIPVTVKVGLAGLVSGAIMSVLPETFHNYAGMRALIIGGGTGWPMVVVALLEFYLLTLIAYGSGAPGGLFAPSLAIGSAIGYLVGFLEQAATGTGSTAAFAIVGMGAFFSAVARTPLTAIVITFELTSNFAILTPLMFACVISSAVGDLVFKGGLYDHLMRWNGIHLRGPGAIESLRTLKASDVLHTKIDVFSSEVLVKDALPVFGTSAQRGFVVVDRGKLVGVVTQTDLAKIKELESLDHITVGAIMTPHPVAVSSHDSLEDILFLFSRYNFSWLPVIYRDELKGIILQSDVLKALFHEEETAVTSGHNPENKSGGAEVDENTMPATAHDETIDKGE
jgi:CIC family chloride channel protein